MSEVDRLPDRWVRTTVGEIANVVLGKTPKGLVESADGDIPFYKVADMNTADGRLMGRTRIYLNQLAVEHYRVRVLPPETVIFPKVGGALATNKKRVLTQAAAIDTNTMGVIPTLAVESTFLFYWFEKLDLKSIAYGAPVPQINKKGVSELPFPLPPLPEQRRIVEAIETHLSRIEAGVENLHLAQRNIERMRASILKAAVEGRLVPQDPNDEPAEVLLGRISVVPFDQGDVAASGLPNGWEYSTVANVGRVMLGRQRSPKYHSGPHMRPYLRVANVFEARIDVKDVMEMDFPPEQYEKYRLHPGDILLNEGQSPELLGRPAIYHGEVPDACFTNSLIRFQPRPGVDGRFALAVFRHYMRSGRFQRESRITTNIAHLSASRFKAIEFPVPPEAEQARISEEVERQFSILDAIERQVDGAVARGDGLRRAVLSSAFSGRLVPQHPTDEPASALLDRIRAEREGAAV